MMYAHITDWIVNLSILVQFIGYRFWGWHYFCNGKFFIHIARRYDRKAACKRLQDHFVHASRFARMYKIRSLSIFIAQLFLRKASHEFRLRVKGISEFFESGEFRPFADYFYFPPCFCCACNCKIVPFTWHESSNRKNVASTLDEFGRKKISINAVADNLDFS